MFEGAERGLTDREVGRAEYDWTNTGGLFDRLGGAADPFPLLLVTGRAEIFIVLQPAVGPSMRA